MLRVPVTSSNVRSVGYDLATRTLEVEFNNGSVYDYAGVPPDVFAQLMQSPSVGSYLAKSVKPKYTAKKVG